MIRYLRLVLAIPLLLFGVACSTNPTVANGGDPDLDAQARQALQQLFDSTPKAKDLQYQAKAVLVFPSIVKARAPGGCARRKGRDVCAGWQDHWVLQSTRSFIRAAGRRTNFFGSDVFDDRLGNHFAYKRHRIVRWCGAECRGGGCRDGQIDDNDDIAIRCLCVHFWPAGPDGRSGRTGAENRQV
jgi:hypothetical protein